MTAIPASMATARKRGWMIWAVFSVLTVLAYLPTFRWMIQRWDETDSYMSHGWLVPPIAAWLIWQVRHDFRRSIGKGSAGGALLLIASLLLHLVAGMADVSSISGLTLVPLLLGFIALRSGWGAVRAAWFPVVFLIFMVPPPEFVISGINFTLKLLAADIAAWLLNVTGLPAVRTGSFMLFGSEKLAIGDVCSGLRSLLSLVSIGVLFAWMIRSKGRLNVIAVLAAMVPAAIIGNGLRICLVSYLVHWLGHEKVFTPLVGSWDLHLFTGAVIFAGALAVLAGASAAAEWLVSGLAGAKTDGTPAAPAAGAPAAGAPAAGGGAGGIGIATMFALAALAAAAVLSNTVLFKQAIQGTSDNTRNISATLGPWMQIDESPASPNEIRGLETRDIVKRVYSDGHATIELVVAYIAHSSRKSAHAQEACLRGGGALVGSIESRRLRSAPVLAKSISIDLNDRRQHVYYWYKIGHTHTAEYLASSLRMFLGGLAGNKAQGASLVRLLTPVPKGESQAAVDSRLEDFTRYLIPELERTLP